MIGFAHLSAAHVSEVKPSSSRRLQAASRSRPQQAFPFSAARSLRCELTSFPVAIRNVSSTSGGEKRSQVGRSPLYSLAKRPMLLFDDVEEESRASQRYSREVMEKFGLATEGVKFVTGDVAGNFCRRQLTSRISTLRRRLRLKKQSTCFLDTNNVYYYVINSNNSGSVTRNKKFSKLLLVQNAKEKLANNFQTSES